MGTFSEKTKLTKTALDRAEPVATAAGTRQRFLFDTTLPGFGVVVGTRTKTFFAQRGNRRVTLGHYGELTVDQGRDKARAALLELQGLAPPSSARVGAPTKAQTVTLRDGLALTLKTMKAKGRSARTIDDYTRRVECYLGDWLDRPLASITRTDANARHHQVADEIAAGKYATVTPRNGTTYTKERAPDAGRYQANSVFRVFRAIYNRVARQYEGMPDNPCVAVDWFREEERDAALSERALPKWYADVLGMDNPVRRDYLLFVLFTGMRRGAAAAAKWDDVDWKHCELYVPNPKGGKDRAFKLPLSDYLMALLKARRACDVTAAVFPDSPFIFPAESTSGHISEPKVKLSVPFSIHGLRHTFITQAYQLGIPEPVIQVLVNHAVSARSSRKITRNYYTPDIEYLRGPMQQITNRLLSIATDRKTKKGKASSRKTTRKTKVRQ
jgi:site-specific recombinase XerD